MLNDHVALLGISGLARTGADLLSFSRELPAASGLLGQVIFRRLGTTILPPRFDPIGNSEQRLEKSSPLPLDGLR
jgi:hypothetical protein